MKGCRTYELRLNNVQVLVMVMVMDGCKKCDVDVTADGDDDGDCAADGGGHADDNGDGAEVCATM